MSRGDQQKSFTELTAYTLGDETMVAGDEESLVLAAPSGRVELVGSDGTTTTLSITDPVAAVAADQYVFALADGSVTAYTTSGIELWSTAVGDVAALAAFGSGGVVGCVTDGGQLVGLDTETGTELFSVDRPHGEVDDIAAVVGGYGRLAVASWSFLTVFDDGGDVITDRNFQGAIEDVALLGEAVVVQLQNGQLHRLSLPTAELAWTNEDADARAIAGLDDGATLAVDGGDIWRLDEHGNADPLSLPGAESLSTAAGGTLLVTTATGEQTVYRMGEPPERALDGSLLTESVGEGDPIRIRLTNTGAETVETTVSVSVTPSDPLRLSDRRFDVSLDPGEETEVATRTEEVTAETPVTIEATAGQATVAEATVSPVSHTDPASALSATGAVEAVTGEGIEAAVTIRNDGDVAARVAFEGAEGVVDPDEAVTLTTTLAADADPDRTVTGTVDGDTAELPVTVPVPDGRPSLTVSAAGDRSNPFLDVAVSTPYEAATIADLAVADATDRLTVDRSLEVDADERVRVAIPLTEAFVADGLTVAAELSNHDVQEQTTLPAHEWSRSDTATGADRPTTAGADPSAGGAATTEPELTVEREVPSAVARGERFTETVSVTNTGTAAAESVALSVDGDRVTIGRLGPDERATIDRDHAVFRTGPVDIDGGRITHADGDLGVPAERVTVEAGTFTARVTADPADPATLRYECTNDGTSPCRIDALGIDPDSADPDGSRVEEPPVVGPADSVTLEHRFDIPADRLDPPFGAGIRYQRPDEDTVQFWTVVRTAERPVASDGDTGGAAPGDDDESGSDGSDPASVSGGPLAVGVRPRSPPVAGRNSTIECVLTAEGELSSVTVEPSGDLVSPLSVGVREVGQLTDGDTERLIVDIEPDASGEAAFELSVTGVGPSGDFDRTFRVSGSVAADQDTAGDAVETWTVAREGAETAAGTDDEPTTTGGNDGPADRTGDGSAEWPTHLVTPYR